MVNEATAGSSKMQSIPFNVVYKPQMIAVDRLLIDTKYQRDENPLAIYIGETFSELAFGRIVVGIRLSGSMYIVDGRQRHRGAIIAKRDRIPCDTFPSSGRSMEAKLFEQINRYRRKVSPLEVFNAALVHGSKTARTINNILVDKGLEVARQGDRRREWPLVRAISSIEGIFRQHGADHLDRVIGSITAHWSEQEDAISNHFLGGVSQFIVALPANAKAATIKIAMDKWDAPTIMSKARAIKFKRGSGHSVHMHDAVNDVLKKCYRWAGGRIPYKVVDSQP